MRVLGLKLLAVVALAGLVAGCVPEDALLTSTAATPPPDLGADVYVARADGSFTIPAIPLEHLPVEFRRQMVEFPSDQVPGTIIINTAERHLYLITGPDTALRYGIAVGRAGFDWSGEAVIASRQEWPTWTPPPEMIVRRPELQEFEDGQPGGPTNPLGARALYLTSKGVDYGYRIHGTPEWESIGTNASSGCIRMINQDIIDLYARAADGAKVIVMTKDGLMPSALVVPKPAAKPKSVVVAKPLPVPVPEAVSYGPV